ncbi:GntR family transcriptional regulator [Streptomyces sp. PTM05]|uniref:GntR family transcriptional regulator n=1 Tax=Streptantibioticus parmotrematis TaxID=2873249 RepID=A0ABS7QXX3_9ACTN|nr:GntR family transcriptional regulator [Streptantibioticus parmotrematis]MBY8888066.1 GntR family transcriptional regulator [Streptantibioticus parmotrematis]
MATDITTAEAPDPVGKAQAHAHAVKQAHAVKRAPAAERVYAHVKQAVLDRSYEGGTLLTEGDLADAVGVSRTPVREGLLRLEAEGLIKLYPKKGALVLPVSAQEIADVVETRLLIEEHAVRKVIPAGDQLLRRLEELLDEHEEHRETGDLARASVTDRCFHAEIVRAAGNAILAHLYDQMRDRQLRMGVQVMHAEPDRIARNITEHAEILAAIRAGDADGAAAAVRRHVGRVKAIVRGEEA